MSVAETILSVSRRHADLFKNSAALALGTGMLAVLGFVFWLVAARLYPPNEIGEASALLALMGVIALLGEVGVGTLIMGELTLHPGREDGLVSAGMLTGLCFGLLGGFLGLGIIDLCGFPIHSGNRVLFVLGCGLTGLWTILNESFVGRLQSHYRTVQQFVFSVAKLAFIVIAAAWMSGQLSMLLSWLVGVSAALLCGELLLRYYGGSLLHRPDFRLLRTLKRKCLDHWLLDAGINAPGIIMPYLAAVLVSPTSNAAFTVLWMIIVIVSAVPGGFATTLFPTINARPDEYYSKMRISFILSMLFVIVGVLIIFLYSQQILGVFNPVYAKIGGNDLRFLGFGMIGSVVKYHACAAARLNDRMRSVSGWFALAGIFELISVTAGCYYGGLEGLAIGWSGAMLVEGALMFWFLMWRGRPIERQGSTFGARNAPNR